MTVLATQSSMKPAPERIARGFMPADIDPEMAREARQDYFADLVRAIADLGDRAAFERLYRYYAPRLKAYGMKLGADRAAAEELAQEAMLVLWRKAASFDPAKASVSTWLFTIVRNRRIDLMRRTGKAMPSADELLPLIAPGPQADDGLLAHEDEKRVARSLAALPDEQREILTLAYFQDKSHTEIAGDLALPLGTVKSRIRLAMARLRQILDQ